MLNFYKMIKNETVIDVGNTFAKWNSKYQQPFAASRENAQFVQGSFHTQMYYYDVWLKVPPEGINMQYEVVVIKPIQLDEYNELLERLRGADTIPQFEQMPEHVETVEEPAETVIEQPLTIPEMREIIKKQQEQIDQLTNAVNKLTEQ